MDVSSLLYLAKDLGRITDTAEDHVIVAMLEAAAGDVLHRANITPPETVAALPEDLQHAICDVALRAYDERGDSAGKPGLTVTAARIASRYRGVSLGAANINGDPEGAA